MIFNEALYPLFLLLSVTVFFKIPVSWRAAWLFVSGLGFYAYYADVFVLLFGLEALGVWFLMRQWRSRKDLYVLGLLIVVFVLGYYKYRNMAMLSWGNLQQLWGSNTLPSVEALILPLAISFFTFEFIHYMVDMRAGRIEKHSLTEYMAFIMFFPTMIAGPIKRFQGFVPQIHQARFDWGHIYAGLSRILIGSAKKIVIADSMDLWIAPLQSGDLSAYEPGTLWVALFAYSIKIYVDFSGYSDIAIGSARLFGIVVPENFNWPYLRPNIAQFWRHWHISLTTWITDYVYKSLGGSRVGFARTLFNTILAMAVSGIWHGAAWHFMVWGLYHGLLLALHRIWREQIKPKLPWVETFPKLYYGLCTALTFFLVTIGWGLFIMPVERFVKLMGRLVGL
ncbi:MAG: MBOAT family protein [Candidatus Melainabacteria bacterium HGW-Melainabacteria-1]|nr:MAG: MBOAT family protein [Candidatus Melainabacteria bacterium HGW-Melainabacteria-1]